MTKNSKITIIAEAGVNHNGSLDLARKLIDAAADAGADFIKFQSFKTERLVSKKARKADYQRNSTEGDDNHQYEMLKKIEIDEAFHKELIAYCKEISIGFLSSAFDEIGIDMLHNLGLKIFKVPSGEITNLPYLQKLGSIDEEVILSTGMASMHEIKAALSILEEEGTAIENITVLHCNTDYPTKFEDVNLKAMDTIRQQLGVKVGYSDHTPGIEVAIAAVAMGAMIVEKHITLDRTMEGPDHQASLEPAELTNMVQSIRNIEQALGDGIKRPSKSELKNKEIVRKSIHLRRDLESGKVITADDLIMLRPGDGISPMDIEKVIGRRTIGKLVEGHKLESSDLKSKS